MPTSSREDFVNGLPKFSPNPPWDAVVMFKAIVLCELSTICPRIATKWSI